jgi:hypothetical protein
LGAGGIALALIGIGLPVLGVPGWLAVALTVLGVAMLGFVLFLSCWRFFAVRQFTRSGETAVREAPTEAAVALRPVSTFRYRDERLDLADDMDAFRMELQQMLGASSGGASNPVQGGLGELARQERDEPEAYRIAEREARSRKKQELYGYRLFWRETAMQFYDAAFAHGVIGRQARAAVVNPDSLQIDNLPDLFERLARRLRYQAADRMLHVATG